MDEKTPKTLIFEDNSSELVNGRRLEIFTTGTAMPKLTVTRTRVSFKFPVNYSKVEEVKSFFLAIARANLEPEFTMRGNVEEIGDIFGIDMTISCAKRIFVNRYTSDKMSLDKVN